MSTRETAKPAGCESLTTTYAELPIALSQHEVAQRRTEIVTLMAESRKLHRRLDELTEERKAITTTRNASIDRAEELGEEADTGERMDKVECLRVPIRDRRLVALRRLDEPELPLVAVEKMGDAEYAASAQASIDDGPAKLIEETARELEAMSQKQLKALVRE